jgi:hypothetical protein
LSDANILSKEFKQFLNFILKGPFYCGMSKITAKVFSEITKGFFLNGCFGIAGL